MKKIKLFCLLGLAASILWGTPAFAAQELIVSAAASLTNAMKEVAQTYEKTHPDTKIVCNFAASGVLLQQMAKGAPVDVFAAADQKTMNQAQEKKLIRTATRKNFVTNRLVLIVPMDSKLTLKSLQELTKPKIKRVAVGNPATVPAGRYSKQALVKAGLWEKLTPKYIMAESVRQVLDYVRRGEVDIGFVYSTDAAIAKGKVKTVLAVTEHAPILYPIAVTVSTGKKDAAQKFLDFVLSPAAQAIFKKYGFGPA